MEIISNVVLRLKRKNKYNYNLALIYVASAIIYTSDDCLVLKNSPLRSGDTAENK